MSAIAQVQDGKIVESASQDSLEKATAGKNGMDKDTFLQLLVAQMQYQDPLEPTSNTEYISQYATFSQVEQMQNMAGTMELSRASGLVGKEVWIKTTASDGTLKYVQGQVDYVSYENGKAYVSVNDEMYSIDDVDTVVDKDYQVAYDKAQGIVSLLYQLPGLNGIDASDVKTIDALEKTYNEMTDYQKQFVASDAVKLLKQYIDKAAEWKTLNGVSDTDDGKTPDNNTDNA